MSYLGRYLSQTENKQLLQQSSMRYPICQTKSYKEESDLRSDCVGYESPSPLPCFVFVSDHKWQVRHVEKYIFKK